MLTNRVRSLALGALAILALFPSRTLAQPLRTAFTFQGELKTGGIAASGPHDLRFRLYDAAAGGAQVGMTLCADNLSVSEEGRFVTVLDFGAVFAGQQRFLEIDVRADSGLDCSDGTGFVTLASRVALTGTPNALFSLTAASATNATTANTATNSTQLNGQAASFYQDASNLTGGTLPSGRLAGTYSGGVGFTNAGNAFNGSGAGLTGLNAGNILTGTLATARGGTGSSITSAVNGQVLKWNGSAFTAQNDLDTTYSAGAGLSLVGTTFSIPAGGISGSMISGGAVTNVALASDAASLLKVSGGAMRSDGANIGIGTVAPTSALHIQTAAPVLAIQSTTNGGSAQIDLFETVGPSGLGGRILYDGTANTMSIGTVNVGGGPLIAAMSVSRGSTTAAFAGDVSVAGNIIIPATTRSLLIPPSSFVTNGPSSAMWINHDYIVNGGDALDSDFVSAPVNLPDGAVITGITFYYIDNSATFAMTFDLVSTSLTTLSGSTVASYTTSGASASVRTQSITGLSQAVNNSLRHYAVRGYWSGEAPTFDLKFGAARIDYTITAPLP